MKKHLNFILRAVNLLLILGVLWQYQNVALTRAAAVAERQQQIDEVNAYNASIVQAEEEEEAKSGLQDGTYEGSAFGFGDTITVSITITDGKLTDISVLSADGEDRPYYNQSLPVLDKILSAQSTDGVDTVSGATLTSEGLINAVADALGKAAA
mgnify:FL=1